MCVSNMVTSSESRVFLLLSLFTLALKSSILAPQQIVVISIPFVEATDVVSEQTMEETLTHFSANAVRLADEIWKMVFVIGKTKSI